MVVVTWEYPAARTVSTRSWEPSGSSRHTVMAAVVAPMPTGWNAIGVVPPACVIWYPSGSPACFWITVAPESTTIQPCSQPPPPAQVVPSDEAQTVTGRLRLIASLRASWMLASRLLAAALRRPPSDALRNVGTPIASRSAAIVSTTISSISVKPRARQVRRPGTGAASGMIMAWPRSLFGEPVGQAFRLCASRRWRRQTALERRISDCADDERHDGAIVKLDHARDRRRRQAVAGDRLVPVVGRAGGRGVRIPHGVGERA